MSTDKNISQGEKINKMERKFFFVRHVALNLEMSVQADDQPEETNSHNVELLTWQRLDFLLFLFLGIRAFCKIPPHKCNIQ